MGCKCACVAAPIATGDTDCIHMSGDGFALSPIKADPIIPAMVEDPVLLQTYPNGISCAADGLRVQPDRNFTHVGGFGGTLGAVPPQNVDTVICINWGAPSVGSITNIDPNRTALVETHIEFPQFGMTLEPGASGEIGYTHGFFSLSLWRMENTGLTTATYKVEKGIRIAHGFLLPGAASFPLDVIQLYVCASGFTTLSHIATFGDANPNFSYNVYPL